VLVKERQGEDYSIYDPYKYGGDAPGKDVLLTRRYKYNGATLATEISAVLWFNSYGAAQPEAPKADKVPVPADKFTLYAGVDDLALRAEPSVNGYLQKRMLQGAELICLEDKAKAKAKIGARGQWIQAQDAQGDQGYVAAWYVSDSKAKPAVASSTAVSAPAPKSAPIPPGAIALYPTAEISLRAQPSTGGAVMRYVPAAEQLISLEAANQTIPKVGVDGQWIKVRGADKQEGYVAAWFVKYAGGSAAGAASATANKSGKVHTTAEMVSLRKEPVVSDATLIKRVPINYEFTIAEPGGEAKVGANNK
jgi:hypothetical protein